VYNFVYVIIDTIALNCLVFEKIAFLKFGDRQTNKETDRQTNRWTRPSHEAAFAVASGGLISRCIKLQKMKLLTVCATMVA